MIVVLEASVAVEVILRRSLATDIQAVLAEADLVIAPDLYVAEVSNALWKYAEADRGQTNALELLDDAMNLPDKFVPSQELYREALSFSIKTHHPVYDSMYAVLARRQSATLLTMDRRLASLVQKEGIGVLPRAK